MNNSNLFSLTDIRYVHRILVGNDNPEKHPNNDKINQQLEELNQCLNGSPKGRSIGQEKNFYILNIGEHQVVMQYMVYH